MDIRRRGNRGAGRGEAVRARRGAAAVVEAAMEALEDRRLLSAVVSSPIADVSLAAGQTSAGVDLSSHFVNTNATGTVVEFDSNLGTFDVQLTDSATPRTVANFLRYVNGGLYNNTIIHRSVPQFIVQGGGYALPGLGHIQTFAPVANEFSASRPNVRGTIAMAKLDGNPDSATSEWFINLGDNSSNLDNQNGGFTTFGNVTSGMDVVDAIAAQPTFSATNINSALTDLPLVNYTAGAQLQASNFVSFSSIKAIPTITYSAVSDNTSFVTASVSGGALTLTTVGGTVVGLAHVTVTATTLDGSTTGTTFVVRRTDGVGPVASGVPASGEGLKGTLSADKKSLTFQVMYADDNLVSVATLGNDDITVTGPNGFSQNATLVSADSTVNASSVTATYQITRADGGAFTAADNGTYTADVNAGAVTDAAGNGVGATTVGSFTVSISTPGGMADLAAPANGNGVTLPAGLVTPTSKNKATVTILNAGTARAKGTATAVLYASQSGTLADAVQLGTARLKVDLGVGLSKGYAVSFKSPTNLPEGAYHLLAAVNTTGSIRESDASNDLLSSAGTVDIQPPIVDLKAELTGRLPTTITEGGKAKTSLAVRVSNLGNVDAKGVTTVRVVASADEALDDSDVRLVTLAKKMTIKAGKSVVVKLKAAPAASLAPVGTPLHLGATVSFAGQPADQNPANDMLFSDSTVTFDTVANVATRRHRH